VGLMQRYRAKVSKCNKSFLFLTVKSTHKSNVAAMYIVQNKKT